MGPSNLADRAREIATLIGRLRRTVGRDLGVQAGTLEIRLYATHGEFAAGLWRLQRARPQSAADDSGSVIHDTLLVGPLPPAYLAHNVAHVYTEWLLDRLTGNRRDELPPNPWLYDGIAEVEAYRYVHGGPLCRLHGPAPFDVTAIRTARAWLAEREGPVGSLEYCLAYRAVRQLDERLGWRTVVAIIRRDGWKRGGNLLRAEQGSL